MYKNQLQELAQRSCFNLPSYTCIREGPDHAPRFKATVNFNGEIFESPNYCSTLRQAEHSAAEVALNALANRGPSNSLAARILDETGVYKNLLQEVSQRVGALLPIYTTFRSGVGHLPIFTCTVELAGVTFTGEPAKNKKQAEKNAAMAAWSSLKLLAHQSESSVPDRGKNDEQEHVTVARALRKYILKAKLAKVPFPIKFPIPNPRPSSIQQLPSSTSKILPLICPRTAARTRPISPLCVKTTSQSRPISTTGSNTSLSPRTAQAISSIINESFSMESHSVRADKFPAVGAAPYIPIRHFGPHHRMAPPVTIRNAVPVFSAPPLPPPSQSPRAMRPPGFGVAPPVCVRQTVPVYAAPPTRPEELPVLDPALEVKKPLYSRTPPVQVEEQLALKEPEIQVHDSSIKVAPSPQCLAEVHVEERPGSRVQPSQLEKPTDFDILPVQVDPVASKNSATPTDVTGIAADKKLQESEEIEKLKQLKI
ncbi:double-stranded RNA-binding protein 2 [Nicotiana tabacum]|uniref:Double-stranded RNA-binding protein 2 n=1 Tax=Nicotiana tabacum TaxID=4097 RepID=A0A1S3ZZ33_TOBAC|nr:double-stranded RNA-binding protein 2-like [Nicotiana tomentosiformis]XP_016469576.1 PREDICTED: double-stranded RNA-binding protein 2-like [Nicotiana tabacum]